MSSYREEPGLKCLVTDSDKQASKEAAKASQEAKFTWVQFSAFADLLTSETQPGKTDPEGGQLQSKAEPSEDEKRVRFCHLIFFSFSNPIQLSTKAPRNRYFSSAVKMLGGVCEMHFNVFLRL